MKKVLLFLAVSIVVVYGLIFVLTGFNITSSSAYSPAADAEMTVFYYQNPNDTYPVKIQTVPLYNNKDGVAVTREKITKMPAAKDAGALAGYRFTGWFVDGAVIAGGAYLPANLEPMGQNEDGSNYYIVYVQWEQSSSTGVEGRKYTITFHANGGTGSMAAQTFESGVAQTIRANSFASPVQKTFEGWSLTPTGPLAYTDGQLTEFYGRTTLYAKWASRPAETYTVSFNANGGTGGMDAQPFTEGRAQALNSNTYTRYGYNFVGWSTSSSSSAAYADGASYTATKPTTLYAIWVAKSIRVRYDSQGGTSLAEKTVTFGSTYGTLSTPTRAGYTFGGWYRNSAYLGSVVTTNTPVAFDADHSLFAKWDKQVKVYFNTAGGTSMSTVHVVVTYQKAYGELPTPTRAGYKFAGWYLNERYDSPVITSSYIVAADFDHILTAKWIR